MADDQFALLSRRGLSDVGILPRVACGPPAGNWVRWATAESKWQIPAMGYRNVSRLAILDCMSSLGFWLVVGAVALVETAIITTALRMRVRTSGRLSIVGRRPAEISWTLLPALLLVALVLLSLQPK